MELTPNKLPKIYDKLADINNTELDPYNVRDEKPSESLKMSVRDDGYRESCIARPKGDGSGRYYITDGWQRREAGRLAGYTVVPIIIFDDPIEALKETRKTSFKKEWTKYQIIKHCNQTLKLYMKRGETFETAFRHTMVDCKITEGTLIRYWDIDSLPYDIKIMIESPKSRTQEDCRILRRFNHRNMLSSKRLSVKLSSYIARKIGDLPTPDLCEVALELMREKLENAIKMVDLISEKSEQNPIEIIYRFRTGSPVKPIYIGGIIFDPDSRKKIIEICQRMRITPKELIRRYLGDLAILEDGTEIGNPIGEIGSIYLTVDNYKIELVKRKTDYVIYIKGKVNILFTYEEIRDRVWNNNRLLSDKIKSILNGLKIKFN